MKVVLDTNVLISAFLWRGVSKEIFKLAKHLLALKKFKGIPIVLPREFLRIITKESAVNSNEP